MQKTTYKETSEIMPHSLFFLLSQVLCLKNKGGVRCRNFLSNWVRHRTCLLDVFWQKGFHIWSYGKYIKNCSMAGMACYRNLYIKQAGTWQLLPITPFRICYCAEYRKYMLFRTLYDTIKYFIHSNPQRLLVFCGSDQGLYRLIGALHWSNGVLL